MLLLLEEVQGEEFVEVAAVELDGCRPVEVVEGECPAWDSDRQSDAG